MNEGQLPTFEKGKVYLLTGEILNQLKDAIIKEIIVDKEEFTISKDVPNKVTLSLADGALGDDIAGVTVVIINPDTMAVEMYEDCTLKGTLGTLA